MKFVTFLENQQEKVGLVWQDAIYDLTKINHNLPSTLIEILADDEFSLSQLTFYSNRNLSR